MSSIGFSSHRDPSPSRWSYRWQRWMLTPGVRQTLRIGVPLVLIGVIATVWFADDQRRAMFFAGVAEVRNSIETRPEFTVTAMAIDGASPEVAAAIREVLPLDFPMTSFDLDLDALRASVLKVGAVADATVRVKSGGILEIHVTPRIPVALWRQDDGLHLIDRDGTDMGAVATRADRPDLLLVAGDGAKEALGEAIAIMAAARPIAPQLRGLVRMGDRRWDLVLERGQRIMLPQDNAIAALQRVVVMAQTQDLLERDIVAVDMRNPDRPTIRLTGGAAAEMRQINAAVSGTGN